MYQIKVGHKCRYFDQKIRKTPLARKIYFAGDTTLAIGSSPLMRMLRAVMRKTQASEKWLMLTAERWKSSRWSRQSRSKFNDTDKPATITCNQTVAESMMVSAVLGKLVCSLSPRFKGPIQVLQCIWAPVMAQVL
jgi:hypothetical protein